MGGGSNVNPSTEVYDWSLTSDGQDREANKSTKGERPSRSKEKFKIPKDKGRLEGKVAIITVGKSGVGEATARLFHRHGAKVIIAGTDGNVGSRLANDLGAIYVPWDGTKAEMENELKAATKQKGKLDIMVNNAEFIDDSTKKGDEYDMQAFEHAVNEVKKVMRGLKHAECVMKPEKKGCIISTACIARITGRITPLADTVSKQAVIGLTKNLAADLVKDGIRVNCVSCDGIGTEDYKSKNKDKVDSIRKNAGNSCYDHIAEAVLLLASEEAKYVNGANLVLDSSLIVQKHS